MRISPIAAALFFSALSLVDMQASVDGQPLLAKKKGKAKGSKKSPSHNDVPGVPPMRQVALVEPFGDASAYGTVDVNYNMDESILVVVNLSFLSSSGGTNGTITLTEGTSCDPSSSGFSTTPFGNGWNGVTNYYDVVGDVVASEAISFSGFRISTGKSLAENFGKTFHVVNSDAAPIGCGVLGNPITSSYLTATMGRYPGYTGPMQASGTVTVTFGIATNDFVFSYDIEGVEANCENCGIHIHAGTSCASADLVLGHGWNKLTIQDLWTTAGGAVYNSNSMGMAKGYFNMNNGFGIEENAYHAVVIHGQDGTRIGCGQLLAPLGLIL